MKTLINLQQLLSNRWYPVAADMSSDYVGGCSNVSRFNEQETKHIPDILGSLFKHFKK